MQAAHMQLPDCQMTYGTLGVVQVKLRGFRIELGEIENVLSRCQNVQLAVVKLSKDSAGTDHLVAYLTPSSVDVEAVKSQTAESVPGELSCKSAPNVAGLPKTLQCLMRIQAWLCVACYDRAFTATTALGWNDVLNIR